MARDLILEITKEIVYHHYRGISKKKYRISLSIELCVGTLWFANEAFFVYE